MSDDTIYRIAELGTFVLALAAILYRLGRMTERFELIARQQATEISELKNSVTAIHDVITSQAVTTTRLDTLDARALSEGVRLDKLADKFEKLDKIVASHEYGASR
jgi:hypothetical protein